MRYFMLSRCEASPYHVISRGNTFNINYIPFAKKIFIYLFFFLDKYIAKVCRNAKEYNKCVTEIFTYLRNYFIYIMRDIQHVCINLKNVIIMFRNLLNLIIKICQMFKIYENTGSTTRQWL